MASPDIQASLLEALRQASRILILTGSGVSAESGVPTFRDAMTGLWNRFRAEELATPEAFRQNPQLVWDWYRERRQRVAMVQPNGAHVAIARLQQRLPEVALVTQNVDGLHQRAGSREVVEFHGNLFSNRCRDCGWVAAQDEPVLPAPPPCTRCGTLMGPGVVWFGEAIPAQALHAAWRAASEAELFFSVGTSGFVYPAASLVEVARGAGATIVEVNTCTTPLTPTADFVLQGPAGTTLPRLLECLER